MIEIFLKTFREDQYSCIQNKITPAFFQVSSLLIFSVFIFMIIFLLDWVFINEKKDISMFDKQMLFLTKKNL